MTSSAARQQTSIPALDARDLAVIRATASAHARKLARSLRLSREERDDVEQDILVTLIDRWHYFDGARGSNIAFAIRIARQALHVLAGRIVADRELETIDIDYAQGIDDASAELEALSVADNREHRLSRGRRPTLLVYRVICSDEDAMHWPEEDIGNLRVALNALMRVFRM